MLFPRVISAIIGIPIFLAAVYYGGTALLLLSAIVIGIATWEMSALLTKLGSTPVNWLAQLGGLSLILSAYLYKENYLGFVLIALLVLHLLVMIFYYPKYSPVDLAGNYFAILYTGLFVFLYLIRTLHNGWLWVLFLLLGTWASDTFAYFVGKSIGAHKLAPALSPKKTIEGAVGGLLGSALVAVAMAFFAHIASYPRAVLLGLAVGLMALLGDLVESTIKRQANSKDSGKLIPGHGGILDRFDSILLTAPFIYYIVKFFN